MNPFCDCTSDGFCERYQREMGGRMREICMGVNVDLGTAAAFREQWRREAGFSQTHIEPKTSLLLKTDQAVGDAVAMTAAIYSLHKAYPGKYITAVESKFPEVFMYNPDVVPPHPGMAPVQMHYPAIHECNRRGIHFMQGWCEFLGMALNEQVPLLTNRPHIYFDTPKPIVEDFWLICSGGKTDFTNKLWGHSNYQKVVNLLRGEVNFIQVGEKQTDHPPLSGVKDKVGSTSLRDLFDLCRRARGVLCGVSMLMHVAAALEKPAVIIAGGREPVQWNAYPKQHYLHTIGMFPCSDLQGNVGGACWRSRVEPLGDDTGLDKDTCERPVNGTPMSLIRHIVPECMAMIDSLQVATIISRYNEYSAHN